MSVINDAQTNRVCVNTAQYIVEYSDVNSE